MRVHFDIHKDTVFEIAFFKNLDKQKDTKALCVCACL